MHTKRGVANLPLHGGHAPRWLFNRMVKLAGGILDVILYEYDSDEFLRRISDPHWFQALSCVIGFDWHSSGTTTTTCGALKTVINPEEHGIMMAGGKGKNSRKTPFEIDEISDLFSLPSKKVNELKYSSRISAKIDNSCIQDGYDLYHHSFIFTEGGNWAVVQQGLNSKNKYARRYHWLSESIDQVIEEPHNAICCDESKESTLNMTASKSDEARKSSVDLICDNPEHLKPYFRRKSQSLLTDFFDIGANSHVSQNFKEIKMPSHHPVLDIDMSKHEFKVLKNAYELQPESYEELISLEGMGPKKIRALALISDLVYGAESSWSDPVKYSFTHGGKDGFPYPVDREVYDHSIYTLKEALDEAKIDKKDKYNAIKRLESFVNLEKC
ncbi:MAG: DUF763 domain-containing protein [Methanobacterium sp.]|uniref:DUF763 domain-containing protein n=1 Tax=Methanobacterium sp. TaxID=2164 RepID=UPI003D6537CE|nr:DUF763 domain-containing protein [Methanobacterium sp.]